MSFLVTKHYATTPNYSINDKIPQANKVLQRMLGDEKISLIPLIPLAGTRIGFYVHFERGGVSVYYDPNALSVERAGLEITVWDSTRETEIFEAIRQALGL